MYNLFLGCSTTLFKPVDINRGQAVRFYACYTKYGVEGTQRHIVHSDILYMATSSTKYEVVPGTILIEN